VAATGGTDLGWFITHAGDVVTDLVATETRDPL